MHEKKRVRAVGASSLALIMLVVLPRPTIAHHAIASTYDQNKTVQVKGKVTQFSWKSPHSELVMSVTDGPYKGRIYAVELDGPVAMMRQGWTSRQFSFGDEVVINVHPAKSGAAYGECLTCTVIINGREAKPKQ